MKLYVKSSSILTVIYNCATLCGFKIFFGSNTLLIPFINSRFSVERNSLRYGFLAKPIFLCSLYFSIFPLFQNLIDQHKVAF